MDDKRLQELTDMAKNNRIDILKAVYNAQSGHIGGSYSCVELLTVLYAEHMYICTDMPSKKDRDRFIASKGHCAPALYAVLAQQGFFPTEELTTLRKLGSRLQGHPDMKKTPGVDISTGSLGMGISAALGMSLASKLQAIDNYTYVLLGDGELQEGQIWESLMALKKFCCTDVITIIDCNKVQLDGHVDEVMPLPHLKVVLQGFGLNTIEIDGHDIRQVDNAILEAKSCKQAPTVIIANTIKGKGVSFMENTNVWHGKVITEQEYNCALNELEC